MSDEPQGGIYITDDEPTHDDWLRDHEHLSPVAVAASRRLWNALMQASDGRIPAPSASVRENGEVFACWDIGEHHFELETLTSGVTEFFYRNRRTNNVLGFDIDATFFGNWND